jgi:transketolase C-terminal domain/subunit
MSADQTRRLNMIEAINEALHLTMARDPDIVVFGEDVGYFGGVFRATAGLQKTFGKSRVFDTPINECGLIGAAVGMAAYGLRPVATINSSPKRRGCAIARRGNSSPRSRSAVRSAAGFLAGRRTANRPKPCSRTFPG